MVGRARYGISEQKGPANSQFFRIRRTFPVIQTFSSSGDHKGRPYAKTFGPAVGEGLAPPGCRPCARGGVAGACNDDGVVAAHTNTMGGSAPDNGTDPPIMHFWFSFPRRDVREAVPYDGDGDLSPSHRRNPFSQFC